MTESATSRRQRAAVAATVAFLLLALSLVAVSSAPAAQHTELEQLKAAAQQPAHRLYHGTSLPQGVSAASTDEQNYLKTVFDSKLAKAVKPSHGDFSAAVAKEARNGVLKADGVVAAAAPTSLPAWVLKNPNSMFAKSIMRQMANKKKGVVGQVWCGAYACDG